MADPTITTINSGTQLLVPAQDDVLAETDVSDTTEASAGTTKPVENRNLCNVFCDWIVCVNNEVVCVDNKVVII